MTSDVEFSPALPHITESMLTATLADASIRDLAQALDPSAFKGEKAADSFTCPDCGFWKAEVFDSFRWQCPVCSSDALTTTAGQRTRLALVRHVEADYEAARRLMVDVNAVGLRAVPPAAVAKATRRRA